MLQIEDVLTYESIINPERNEPRYLIIPAAGLGTRMRSINPDTPKELLPIGNKPAIQYAVEEGISAGVKDIIVIISKQKEMIRRYLEDRKFAKEMFPKASNEIEELAGKCSMTFLYQKKPLGESDAMSYAGNIAGGHSVAVIYPDDIYLPAPGALKILKSVYARYSKDVIGLMEVTEGNAHALSNTGRIDIKPVGEHLYSIVKFHQKIKGRFIPRFKRELRTCGMSIFGPYLFEYIERARHTVKEEEFTDGPVLKMILKDKEFLGYRLPGNVFDIGNPYGYELCVGFLTGS